MAANKLMIHLLAIVVCIAAIASHADGSPRICQTVVNRVEPCRDYLRIAGKYVRYSCCEALETLNSEAKTDPERSQQCECLKAYALEVGRYKAAEESASLPEECGENGYNVTIHFNTDCNKFL